MARLKLCEFDCVKMFIFLAKFSALFYFTVWVSFLLFDL